VNVLTPGGPARPDRIIKIVDGDGITRPLAQPGATATLYLETPPRPLDLLRRRSEGAAQPRAES
jgi:hypothetical protein